MTQSAPRLYKKTELGKLLRQLHWRNAALIGFVLGVHFTVVLLCSNSWHRHSGKTESIWKKDNRFSREPPTEVNVAARETQQSTGIRPGQHSSKNNSG